MRQRHPVNLHTMRTACVPSLSQDRFVFRSRRRTVLVRLAASLVASWLLASSLHHDAAADRLRLKSAELTVNCFPLSSPVPPRFLLDQKWWHHKSNWQYSVSPRRLCVWSGTMLLCRCFKILSLYRTYIIASTKYDIATFSLFVSLFIFVCFCTAFCSFIYFWRGVFGIVVICLSVCRCLFVLNVLWLSVRSYTNN